MGILPHFVAQATYTVRESGPDVGGVALAIFSLAGFLIWILILWLIIQSAVRSGTLSALRQHHRETKRDRQPVVQYVPTPAPTQGPAPTATYPQYAAPTPRGYGQAPDQGAQGFVIDDTDR